MHEIIYKNCYSTWDEALPLGNGHFGAMAYLEKDRLIFAINHYDVYFQTFYTCSEKKRKAVRGKKPTDASRYGLMQQRALEMHNDQDTRNVSYNFAITPELKDDYGFERIGATHPMTCELTFILDESIQGSVEETRSWDMSLNIEKAEFKYHMKSPEGKVELSAMISPNEDVMITEINRTAREGFKALEIAMPHRRYLRRDCRYAKLNEHTVYCINTIYPEGEVFENKPFKYICMVRIIGASETSVMVENDLARITMGHHKEDCFVLMGIVTEEETENLLEAAIQKLEKAEQDLSGMIRDHKAYWQHFWQKSSITLPDKLLEHLWYLHLYILECCSGRGARLFEQACGLNGLWDIKQPSQWGSSWYWDVNIQQSFWPVYTSNHLDIGESFYRALLSHKEAAQQRAKQFFGMRGIAADYPFEFFNAIWPWCAQFFWWHFKYSGDLTFLKEQAYPLFREILMFYEDYLKYDAALDRYEIYPDISPEQGPLTKNSTISLACLKYLLESAMEANEILQENSDDHERWGLILRKLPDYPTGESPAFGTTLKDSEWAEPLLYLAHPSVLMPVYPLGYLNKRCDQETIDIAENTLKYVGEYHSLGTFNFAWEACAAARLGKGNDAVRLLYEKGIAFSMRANGMFAEETERWMQNCLTSCAPVFSPPMMEAGGSTVAAINEMLLQSFQGVIEVFPAIPRESRPDSTVINRFGFKEPGLSGMEAWQDCAFEHLLAEGAFEVSARFASGETREVQIKSLAGNTIRLVHPFPSRKAIVRSGQETVEYVLKGFIIEFPTEADKEYAITPLQKEPEQAVRLSAEQTTPLVYSAPSNRRVFLGKDEPSEFIRELDKITFDYYQGDIRTSKIAVYRMDFSVPKEILSKDYLSVLPRQFHLCGKLGLDFKRITEHSLFSHYTGYGWENNIGIKSEDRGGPDVLRRDFVSGTGKSSFLIELTKGQYQLFFVTGDHLEPTYTEIAINGRTEWTTENTVAAGRYRTALIPAAQREDGYMTVSFSASEACRWKINMLIVNRV